MLNAYPRDCGARLQHHLWRLRCRPLLMKIPKMTTDRARRLAQHLDLLKERLDVCCPPAPIPVPLKAEGKKEEK